MNRSIVLAAASELADCLGGEADRDVYEHCDAVADSFAAAQLHEYWPESWLPLPRHRIAQLSHALQDFLGLDESIPDQDMLRRYRKFVVPPLLHPALDEASVLARAGAVHVRIGLAVSESNVAVTEDIALVARLFATPRSFAEWVDPDDAASDELLDQAGRDMFDEAELQVGRRVPALDGAAQVALMRFCWEIGADLDTSDDDWNTYIEEGLQILASMLAQGVEVTQTPTEVMERLDVDWHNEFPTDPTDPHEWEARRLWKFRPSPYLVELAEEELDTHEYLLAAERLADWADDRIIAEADEHRTDDFALYQELVRPWAEMSHGELTDAQGGWPKEAFHDGGPFEGQSALTWAYESLLSLDLSDETRRKVEDLVAARKSALEPATTPSTSVAPVVQAQDNTTGRCFGCGKSGMIANRYCRQCMKNGPQATSTPQVLPQVTTMSFDGAEPAGQPALRTWQRQALESWSAAGCRGVVQAVTGTGKTRVGLQAAAAHRATGGQVLVLVPTLALLHQWDRQLVNWFGRGTVGRFGDSFRDTFRTHPVLIATPHSARTGTGAGTGGLLIADECHRYGSQSWFDALDPRFHRRLGLTATYERDDDGDDMLADYFGQVPVFDIDYRRAIDEGVVSRFRLAFVGVDLGREDREAYEEFDATCRRAAGKLINDHGLPAKPFGAFMQAVTRAANGEDGGPAQRAAWSYQSSFSKRRRLLAETPAKTARLRALEPSVARAKGTLVFTQTKQAAQEAAELFGELGHPAAAIWGELKSDEREYLLEAFRQGARTVLSAPRVLDEGIDVPDADLGIVVSASRGRRQMIQRMGRVLRQKTDGRLARMVVLYAEGTAEDPEQGAHEGFIDLAWEVADARATFLPAASGGEICDFLEAGAGP